jgi:hypothetical protein
MRSDIDTDRRFQTGWKGYDYRVIEGAVLQCYENHTWVNQSKVVSSIDNNQMMITIPRKALALPSTIDIEFKWSDNMSDNDPLDWYVNGDAAPGGRFNYLYGSHRTR